MNAAARLVHRNVVSRQLVLTRLLSGRQLCLIFLTLSMLASALGIVYFIHVNRGLNAHYQRQITEYYQLGKEHSQLVLEHSTLLRQSRIRHIAKQQLGMIMPTQASSVVIHE